MFAGPFNCLNFNLEVCACVCACVFVSLCLSYFFPNIVHFCYVKKKKKVYKTHNNHQNRYFQNNSSFYSKKKCFPPSSHTRKKERKNTFCPHTVCNMPECTEYCCRYNRKNLFCAYIYLRIAHLLSCPPGRKSCLWCVQYALLLCYFVISRSFSEAEVNFMENSSQSKCKVRSVNMLVLLCSSLCGLNFLMC